MSTLATKKIETLMDVVHRSEGRERQIASKEVLDLLEDLVDSFRTMTDPESVRLVDRRLEYFLQKTNAQSQTLRNILLQYMTTMFDTLAGGARGYREAYQSACNERGSQPEDGPYFRNVLIAQLLDAEMLPIPNGLRLELLAAFARYEIDYNAPHLLTDETTTEQVNRLPQSLQAFALIRRWIQNDRAHLPSQGHTIENRLLRQHHFEQIQRENSVFHELLTEMGYVSSQSFFARLRRLFSTVRRWLHSVFVDGLSAFGTSRTAIYLLLGLFFLAAAIGVWVAIINDNARMSNSLSAYVERLEE